MEQEEDLNELHENTDIIAQTNGNFRRQMLLNHVLLVEAAHQQGQTEAYEELKRLIIFAGIFFLFMIIFVLLKFQWSPVVWLIGVIICGLLMNIFLQLKKFIKRRRDKRLREQQNLLYSLNLPTSFPCLAPPPHNECCQCASLMQNSQINPPTMSNRRLLSASTCSLTNLNPPIIIPSYDQVMKGTKTWILSQALPPSLTSNRRSQPLPPTYSTIDIPTESCANPDAYSDPEERACSSRSVGVVSQLANRLNVANTPPPAYDESVDEDNSNQPIQPPSFTNIHPSCTLTQNPGSEAVS